MSETAWDEAKRRIDKFDASLEGTSPERQSALALAEIARQLIRLNANTDVASDVAAQGLNRIADNIS